jgi:hypothetical protein
MIKKILLKLTKTVLTKNEETSHNNNHKPIFLEKIVYIFTSLKAEASPEATRMKF